VTTRRQSTDWSVVRELKSPVALAAMSLRVPVLRVGSAPGRDAVRACVELDGRVTGPVLLSAARCGGVLSGPSVVRRRPPDADSAPGLHPQVRYPCRRLPCQAPACRHLGRFYAARVRRPKRRFPARTQRSTHAASSEGLATDFITQFITQCHLSLHPPLCPPQLPKVLHKISESGPAVLSRRGPWIPLARSAPRASVRGTTSGSTSEDGPPPPVSPMRTST
jgi:hypothetical protein